MFSSKVSVALPGETLANPWLLSSAFAGGLWSLLDISNSKPQSSHVLGPTCVSVGRGSTSDCGQNRQTPSNHNASTPCCFAGKRSTIPGGKGQERESNPASEACHARSGEPADNGRRGLPGQPSPRDFVRRLHQWTACASRNHGGDKTGERSKRVVSGHWQYILGPMAKSVSELGLPLQPAIDCGRP